MKTYLNCLIVGLFVILLAVPDISYSQLNVDNDGDGQCETPPCAVALSIQPDCDDTDPFVFTKDSDTICDWKDSDCDGGMSIVERDDDGDGYGRCSHHITGLFDCNDTDASMSPGRPEICADGKDNDCNGSTDEAGCIVCPDSDVDGHTASYCGGDDCDDSNASIYPGASEQCDGLDNNCDGIIVYTETDDDGDGVLRCNGDCDDNNPAILPGATEICNGVDDNCDGILFPNETDVDNDGSLLCDPIPDCNNYDSSSYPGAPEICVDNRDNNCNGQIDEAGCLCPDNDGDGETMQACGGTDCNDLSPNVNSAAVEDCIDGYDNDCNGLIDFADPNAVNCPACTDADGDNFRIDGGSCGQVDCDDTDPNVYPGAPEICDGKDSNCDGAQSFTDRDDDSDGVAKCNGDCDDNDPDMNPNNPEICGDGKDNNCNGQMDEAGCQAIPGCDDVDSDTFYAASATCTVGLVDCDDNDPYVYPGAIEVCDGKDSNCDGNQSYTDVDADGDQVPWCAGDCDDNDPTRYPGAVEECNGIDDDCNGILGSNEQDTDNDGYLICGATPDCNDNNGAINPGAPELCGDNIDNDCDTLIDCADPNAVCASDNDGDGVTDCNGDCDDTNAAVYPGAPELCDGLDNDCDGIGPAVEGDSDNDGFTPCDATPDCDDSSGAIFPGAVETCGDNIDNDCDTLIDCNDPNSTCATDNDGDGIAGCNGDCDDNDPTVYPGSFEQCDGLDNNCDGTIPANETDSDTDGVRMCDVPPDCDNNNASVLACSLSALNVLCPTTLYIGEAGSCTASAASNGTVNYSWSSLGTITPTGNQASVYFTSDGIKNVAVTATLAEHAQTTDSAFAIITVQPWTVSMSCTNTAPNLGDTFICTASPSVAGLVTGYNWSSGTAADIVPGVPGNATITAMGAGAETITVNVCTDTGYCQAATVDITVSAPTITAGIACPSPIYKNQTGTCTSTATLSSGTYPLSYEWTSTGTITPNGTWADVEFLSQGNHAVTLKVFLTNYPTVETTVNTAVVVTGYTKPVITIDGPTDVLINSQHTYTANVTSPSGPVDITWDIDGTAYTGSSVVLDITDIAVKNINIEARVQGSGTDLDALGTEYAKVVVHVPNITIYLSGDRKSLLGMPHDYTATTSISDSPFHAEFLANLQGQWVLHDSSTSMSNPVSVTFDTEGNYILTYRAWVTGYETYEKTASISVKAEEYVFGPFNIHSYSRSEGQAPFYASLAATGTMKGASGAEVDIKYYWSFDGEPLTLARSRASHFYDTEGAYTINLKVTDKFGNESLDNTVVNIVPPPPLTLAMAEYYSSRTRTVPLTLASYPRTSGGIKGDRIETYSWKLNGVEILPSPYMLIKRIDTPGTYTVEFSGTMGISGQVLTDTFSFTAYESITSSGSGYTARGTVLSISGNSKMLPNDDLSLTASIVETGTVRTDGVMTWATPNGDVGGANLILGGSNVPSEGLTLTVKGHLPESPEKQYYNRIYIRRVMPAKPMLRILSAPRTAIVGQPITFNGFAKASSINAGREIATDWLLPNGTTVAGDELNITTTDADFVDNKMIVKYRGWLVGYEAETLQTLTISVTKDPYLWPGTFALENTPNEVYAPAGVTMKAVPQNSIVSQYTLNRNIKYTWILPTGVSELLRRGNEIKVRMETPGTYNVTVNMTDILGNTATVSFPITALERVLGMTLTASYNKTALIEPLKVSIRPTISNLEGDIVTSIAYSEPITGQTGTGSSAAFELFEGNYNIEVIATTRDGKTVTQTQNVTVGASTPPNCTITYTVNASVKTVNLNSTCTDPDQYDGVMTYQWNVGSDIISYSYRAFYQYATSGQVTVDLTVTDKAGKSKTISQLIDIP